MKNRKISMVAGEPSFSNGIVKWHNQILNHLVSKIALKELFQRRQSKCFWLILIPSTFSTLTLKKY